MVLATGPPEESPPVSPRALATSSASLCLSFLPCEHRHDIITRLRDCWDELASLGTRPQLQAQRGSIQFGSFFYPKGEKMTKIEQTISAGRELQVRGSKEKQRHHSAITRIRWGRARLELPPLNLAGPQFETLPRVGSTKGMQKCAQSCLTLCDPKDL